MKNRFKLMLNAVVDTKTQKQYNAIGEWHGGFRDLLQEFEDRITALEEQQSGKCPVHNAEVHFDADEDRFVCARCNKP